jgi:hypothetical protein
MFISSMAAVSLKACAVAALSGLMRLALILLSLYPSSALNST